MKWSLRYANLAAFLAGVSERGASVDASAPPEVHAQVAAARVVVSEIVAAKVVGPDTADYVIELSGFANPGAAPPPQCRNCHARDPHDTLIISIRHQGTQPVADAAPVIDQGEGPEVL